MGLQTMNNKEAAFITDTTPLEPLYDVEFIDENGSYPVIQQCDYSKYELIKDFRILFKYETGDEYVITIKKGFIFDGFSVPRLFRFVQGKLIGGVVGALLHDVAYVSHFMGGRRFADWALLIILKKFGYSWIKRNTIWIVVKMGGGFVYTKTPAILNKSRKNVIIEGKT